MKNTYDLNELLHKMDIDERLRSQFVGTTLLYLKKLVEKFGAKKIDEELKSITENPHEPRYQLLYFLPEYT